jgi:nucleoside-diphosphate-sugar epimerase
MNFEKPLKTKDPLKVLVTGGGGFLGRAIVQRLVERGDKVYSFSRGFYSELESLGVGQFQGDVSDKKAVEKACDGIDLVFHVAAKFGVWGNYDDYYRTNVIGTLNVIHACETHHVNWLVYTSTPNVIFDGNDMEGVDESIPYPKKFPAHYPKTKAIAEQNVVKAARGTLKTIILRPHFIWGPRDNALPRIMARANHLRIVGDGKNRVDTIFIDDAANAHILAADSLEQNKALSGNIYFLSQGKPVYLWDMINAFLKAADLDPVIRKIPRRLAWLMGALIEFIYKIFRLDGEPQLTRYIANILSTSHWFDIGAARKDLGYVPTVSIEEGLCKLEDWLKSDSRRSE